MRGRAGEAIFAFFGLVCELERGREVDSILHLVQSQLDLSRSMLDGVR
jgi:hypothetical protein